MGWFSSDEKSAAATHPVNVDVTKQYGSAAEQDRYGQHFSSDAIRRGVDEGLEKLRNAAMAAGSGAEQDRYASHLSIGDRGYRAIMEAAKYQGDGAEQDRYNAHFSPALHSVDSVKAVQAAGSVVANGEKNASWFGLGYDGQQRAKLMAGSGMGAEQDRFGSHFALTKDTVANAAQRVKDGAQDVLSKR
ncbi:hypothetical protein ACJQWK_02119 [Exserohilum turcicum]|uniref:Uncharacterized protein n=1 Tax=Exserohilum turcicum (strain 28A) TaxID=671987 RepID=R0IUW3_EXST2|nr:uncharacterized protein SETTUDRAFT_168335 [Exserohilum turcica Et28A]EOA88426.1 hypothetical protein SETTUDRAFT_168335 [Exserohilum turcica Et28A]